MFNDLEGNPNLFEPNHWQPLTVEEFIDQSENYHPGGYPEFLLPAWGIVITFSLTDYDLSLHSTQISYVCSSYYLFDDIRTGIGIYSDPISTNSDMDLRSLHHALQGMLSLQTPPLHVPAC